MLLRPPASMLQKLYANKSELALQPFLRTCKVLPTSKPGQCTNLALRYLCILPISWCLTNILARSHFHKTWTSHNITIYYYSECRAYHYTDKIEHKHQGNLVDSEGRSVGEGWMKSSVHIFAWRRKGQANMNRKRLEQLDNLNYYIGWSVPDWSWNIRSGL